MKGGVRLDVEQTKRVLAGLVAIVMFGGLGASVGWALWRGRRMLPPRVCTLPPWSVGEVLLAVALFALVPLAAFQIVQSAGFFRWYYGADPDPKVDLDLFRAGVWIELAVPLTVVAILLVLHLASKTRPWQVGLSRDRLLDNLAVGCIAFVIATPLTFAVHFLVLWAYRHFFSQEPVQHLLQQLALKNAHSTEWVLLVLQAVVWAPLREEFMMRGVILPWATRRWWGGLACAVAGMAVALASPTLRPGPILFSTIVGAIVLLSLRRKSAEQAFWANLGTSLLFAALHSRVWPTPIPLLFFSLMLGWLQQRTQSLWGPILLHSLFNGFSTLMLLTGAAANSN